MPVPLLGGSLRIPAIGYGVGTAWYKSKGEKSAQLVASLQAALDHGFTHIDDAEMYENGHSTGEAIRQWLDRTGTSRDQLFITSKIISVDEGVENVCRRSLDAMKLDYFDLYLVHAPCTMDGKPFRTPLPEVWRQMEQLVDKGLARQIGVSNWRLRDLREVIGSCRIPPACNQVEAHPYLQQEVLLRYCQQHSIQLTAYAPLASLTKPDMRDGPVDEAVNAAARAHGRTPAQVLLRWSVQLGRGVITTTSQPQRMEEFLSVFDFELTPDEVRAPLSASIWHTISALECATGHPSHIWALAALARSSSLRGSHCRCLPSRKQARRGSSDRFGVGARTFSSPTRAKRRKPVAAADSHPQWPYHGIPATLSESSGSSESNFERQKLPAAKGESDSEGAGRRRELGISPV